MEYFRLLIILAVLGFMAAAAAAAGIVIAVVGAHWLPLVSVIFFCLAVVGLAALVTEIEQRRREIGYTRKIQTMQIKVEADTGQACAAIDDLQRRVENVTAMMVALERLAIHNVMGEVV